MIMMLVVMVEMMVMVMDLVRAWYSLFPSEGQIGPGPSSKI